MGKHWSLLLTATKINKYVNKAVVNYPHALKFVLDCCVTQKMCVKTANYYPTTIKYFLMVNRCFFVFDFILDWYKT